jgi:sugar phosphate isomerase/epimerase
MGGPYEKRLKGEIPMPKFACQCITWGPANNSENKELIFREVKQAGFAGLEMGARNLRPEFVDFYKEMLDKYELELAALHCGGEFTSDAAIEKNYASLQEAITIAKAMGLDKLFFSGFPNGWPDFKRDDESEFRYEAKVLERFGKECLDNGITLCYHNHHWEFLKDKMGLNIIFDVNPDYLKLVPDVGWVTRGGDDPVEFVKKYADRIVALHFKEFTAQGDFTELGTGIVNFPGVYELYKDDPDIWIVAEQDQSKTTPLESATANCRYLKTLAGI